MENVCAAAPPCEHEAARPQMSPYDDRHNTLDPGLTALTLRARRDAGRYPFLDRPLRARRFWLLAAGAAGACLAAWRARVVRRAARHNGDATAARSAAPGAPPPA